MTYGDPGYGLRTVDIYPTFRSEAHGSLFFGANNEGYVADIVAQAVPEPATYLTGLLTLVALGYHQRRRWRCLLRRHVTSHL